ncbi:MAG: hypothetical protein ACOVRN_17150 [Flavobacterium sp.]
MKKIQMPAKKFIMICGATLLLFSACSPAHRYGCNRRCRISLSAVVPQNGVPVQEAHING